MRDIVKTAEPASLTQHRSTPHASYDNYQDKDTLRRHLVSDQRGLCCYCMSRIRADADHMKIEHWNCQDRYSHEQLDYGNMLASCLGGEGRPWSQQHCDTRKQNQDLSRNPANSFHRVQSLLRYQADGTILSDDAVHNEEINYVLNLNLALLKNNRRATLDAFKATLNKRGALSRETLERMLRRWNGDSDTGELEPFCQVVVYWLRKRLRL